MSSLLYRNQPSSLLVQSPHLHLRVRFVHNDVSVRLIPLSFAGVAYLQSGEAAPPRCFFAASSPRRRPRGWGGNAPPRFLDPRLAREHLRLGRAAQQHNQALKRFKRIGNRSAGGTAESKAGGRPPRGTAGTYPRPQRRSYGTQSPIQFSILTHARYERYGIHIESVEFRWTAAIESHSHFPFQFNCSWRLD